MQIARREPGDFSLEVPSEVPRNPIAKKHFWEALNELVETKS
jgi:hypothetical protein